MKPAEDLLQALIGEARGAPTAGAGAPIRAFAWARVSTGTQGDRGQSLPEQLRQIHVYAEQHGIQIVEEFTEMGSAFQQDARRIEFHRMVDRAKRDPEITTILVHDFSRFSRDSLRAQILIRDLRAAGVRVISLSDPEIDHETSAGAYMSAITFAKNEAFSRDIALATRRGCQGNVRVRDPETGWCYSNGGQPLWGYKARTLRVGTDRKGKGIDKTVWVLDDTVIGDRPIHEWVRHVLVEMAGQHESLKQMRDFCEARRLPPQRKTHWGTSSINALLQPYILVKYTGVGIWNVHQQNGDLRPREEWVIVPNAHPAILTPEEATQVARARSTKTRPSHFPPPGRSRTSRYLLSGGLFKCGRCGENMIGHLKKHYVCGSAPYRRGRGCGPGVYVPVKLVEEAAIRGIRELVAETADAAGFAKRVNEEVARLWAEQLGQDPEAERKLAAIDAKIARVRLAIEDGLQDAVWANERLRDLNCERATLQAQAESGSGSQHVQVAESSCPKVSAHEAAAMRRDVERLFVVEGAAAEKKQLLRIWIQEIKLAPERREVELTYRVPEPMMNKLVAGAGFEPATFGL